MFKRLPNPSPGQRRFVLAVSLAITIALGLRDADIGPENTITSTVVIGPLLAAFFCTTRQVMLVAGVATTFALLSFTWTDDSLSVTHQIRQLTVLAVSAAAILIAASRERLIEVAKAEQRFEAALDAMAGAVLLQRPGEGIVYANRAAAKAFGLPDSDGVVRSTPEEIAEAWITTDEEGRPLSADRYPSRRILTGDELHPEPLITHGVHKETGRKIWLRVTATPVFAPDGSLEFAVSVSEDITAIKRNERFNDVLARTGEILGDRFEGRATLEALADCLVPDLADRCSLSIRVNRDPVEVVAGSGDPSQDGTTESPTSLHRAQVAISGPGGRKLGTLEIENAESKRQLSEDELELAGELGRRIGLAMENARLDAEQSEAATVLQMALMPREIPNMHGYAAAATYRPAGEGNIVGGDFYDAFRTARSWIIVVGDIVGRGIRAAALTAQARHVMRSHTMFTGDIAQAVRLLNRVLNEDENPMALCTIAALELPDDPEVRPARILCAGHPSPVLVRDGQAQAVGEWGPIVGAFSDSAFAASELPLSVGDLLVLYTDGLVDAKGRNGRFGEERLFELLTGTADPGEVIGTIRESLAEFEASARTDDTAVVAVRYTGTRKD